jgi:hypothetical protein
MQGCAQMTLPPMASGASSRRQAGRVSGGTFRPRTTASLRRRGAHDVGRPALAPQADQKASWAPTLSLCGPGMFVLRFGRYTSQPKKCYLGVLHPARLILLRVAVASAGSRGAGGGRGRGFGEATSPGCCGGARRRPARPWPAAPRCARSRRRCSRPAGRGPRPARCGRPPQWASEEQNSPRVGPNRGPSLGL